MARALRDNHFNVEIDPMPTFGDVIARAQQVASTVIPRLAARTVGAG